MRRRKYVREAQVRYNNLGEEVHAILKKYIKENGRTWKSKLRLLWTTGADERETGGWALRLIRNTVGPSELDHLVP